mmetsp:Transcript_37224/g.50373  ORF Transcript_37224/g.50373 Transcript_37224/m.50373 type:complete len:303 (-) Transcript_37224:600-1508(-)
MHASAAPPMKLPPMKHCGNVLHSVMLDRADLYLFPWLSLANSNESMLMTRYVTPMASNSLVIVQQNSQYSSDHITTSSATLAWFTNASASAVTGGIVMAGGGALGVDAAIALSSSVMSAGMPLKSGVEMYRSAPSASMMRTLTLLSVLSSLRSRLLTISKAPASVPPPLVPLAMPSSRARSLAAAIASPPPTCRTSSTSPAATASSTSFGIKSVAQPCKRWGRHTGCGSLKVDSPLLVLLLLLSPADDDDDDGDAPYSVLMPLKSSGALSGSQTTIFVCGDASLKADPTPFSVPPVPYAATR